MTQLLIYSPAALHRDAFQGLSSRQPGLTVSGAVCETSHLLPYIQLPSFVRGTLGRAAPRYGRFEIVRSWES